jgi:hypothetical protein
VAAACLLRRSLVCRAAGDYYGSTAGLVSIRGGLQWPWFRGGWSTEHAVRMTTRSRRVMKAMASPGDEGGHADNQRAVGPRAGVLEQVHRVGNDRQDNAGRRAAARKLSRQFGLSLNINQRHGPGRCG